MAGYHKHKEAEIERDSKRTTWSIRRSYVVCREHVWLLYVAGRLQ